MCVIESGEERNERKASAWCALRQAKTKGRTTGKAKKKQRGGRIRVSEKNRAGPSPCMEKQRRHERRKETVHVTTSFGSLLFFCFPVPSRSMLLACFCFASLLTFLFLVSFLPLLSLHLLSSGGSSSNASETPRIQAGGVSRHNTPAPIGLLLLLLPLFLCFLGLGCRCGCGCRRRHGRGRGVRLGGQKPGHELFVRGLGRVGLSEWGLGCTAQPQSPLPHVCVPVKSQSHRPAPGASGPQYGPRGCGAAARARGHAARGSGRQRLRAEWAGPPAMPAPAPRGACA